MGAIDNIDNFEPLCVDDVLKADKLAREYVLSKLSFAVIFSTAVFATAMNILELIYFNANFNSCGSHCNRNITF